MKNQTLSQLAHQIIALRSAPSPTPAPLTYKSGGNTSAMIALFLPATYARKYALSDPGALDPSEMHITLAYLGKADQIPGPAVNSIHEFMELVSENHPPLTGYINGCGRFCNGDDDGDPFFIIPDLAALPNLRQAIIDGLGNCGINAANDHGFVPHITLTYLPHAEYNPFDIIEKTPITFGSISLVLGDDRYDYPLAQGAPFNCKALVKKIGARHTGAECALIQKMHDLTLDLGAECHPLIRRAGARHSHADQGMVQRIHDDCRGLGAECKALPERDPVYSSQTLKDGEIIKGGPTSGNWGHGGRPGKLGGSSGGGGFRRIGVKGGKKGAKKLGRKGIKKASRQTRAKDERAKGGGIKGKSLPKTADVVKNPKKLLSGGAQVALDNAGKGNAKKFGIAPRAGDRDSMRELSSLKLGTLSKDGGIELFKLNEAGLKARENLTKGKKSKKPKKKSPAPKRDLSKMSKGELNAGFLSAKNHKERTSFAEELLKGFSDNTVAKSKKDIPKLKDRLQPGAREITDKGKNAIFRLSGGAMGLGKVLQGASGKFWNGNFGQIEEVTPVFKADLTTKAQSDAPNYQPASTPQRCANCLFFLGDPGRDWCEKFDFTADPDYHCDDWEAGRPDEIPGYVANKADLAALTEGVLALRGKVKLT
jgi:2'-5' RNA ligase